MIKLSILKIFSLLVILVFFGCAEHKVDTVEEWCEQINGLDLDAKYRPFWAVFFGVSFERDSVRDEYSEMLNKLHLEKVGNRAPKLVWSKGTNLHLVNISSLLVIEPEQIINEWKRGIELSKQFKHHDSVDRCLNGTLISLFDNLHIHTIESDAFGKKLNETIVIIPTKRDKISEQDSKR